MSRKHKNQVVAQVEVPVIPPPEPPKEKRPATCENCVHARAPMVKNTLKCTLNPPVFVGLGYGRETLFPSNMGYAQVRVHPDDTCGQHKEI